MATIYQLYEKRIEKRFSILIDDMNKQYSEIFDDDAAAPKYTINAMAVYLRGITKIIMEECKNDDKVFKRLLPKYLPEGITLRKIRKKIAENTNNENS